MRKFIRVLVKYFLMSVSCMFISCVNDVDLSNVSPEILIDQSLVFPIGHKSTSLYDIYEFYDLENELILENNEINLVVRDSVIIKLPVLEVNKDVPPYVSILNSEATVPVLIGAHQTIPVNNTQRIFDLGFNNTPEIERVDSVKISGGVFDVRIDIEDLDILPSDLILSLVFENGASDIVIDISPSEFNDYYPVEIPAVVLNTAGSTEIIANLIVKTANRPILFNTTSKIVLNMKYNTVDYDVVYGKFKSSVLSTYLGKVKFDLPHVYENSFLKFANPKLDITAISNVGAALNFHINYIEAFNSTKPSVKVAADFDGKKSYNLKFDSRPYIPGQKIVQKIPQLNNLFGKLDQLFDNEYFPNRLGYEFSIFSETEVSGIPDFLTPDASVKLLLDAKIPLHFKEGSYFSIDDSIPNVGSTISSIVEENVFDTAILVLSVNNGLPANIKFKMIGLVDSLGVPVLQSGFDTEYVINAASVDVNGYATKLNQTKLYFKVGKKQIEELQRMKFLKYKMTLNAKNSNEIIHFTKDDTFGVNLGIFLKANTLKKI